jgi:hypothetical protein
VGCGCCLGFVSGLVVYVFFGFGEVGFFWQQIVAGLLIFSLPCCRLRWFSTGLDILRVGL